MSRKKMKLEKISSNKVSGGIHYQYQHSSNTVNCTMQFAIFLPSCASNTHKVPVLYWLSGLTCSDENFMQKAGALHLAEKLGLAIVAADTSPRGEGVPDDKDSYDFGQGAGFYLNATEEPWNKHYHMYDYIVDELPLIIENNFPVSNKRSISGHSMGGHGALVIGLRNPQQYQSISAFSPITNPSDCPWGKKAFSHYLGSDEKEWRQYDASILLAQANTEIPILIHQGGSDSFLKEQLKPHVLLDAAKTNNYLLNYQEAPGYDHSYYFISSFIDEHLCFHDQFLKK
tara:strand:- start:6705 stop:7562 length:858 start_codon:yes stop_codon:yes gene_type:complete